jgi:hypothetical protein
MRRLKAEFLALAIAFGTAHAELHLSTDFKSESGRDVESRKTSAMEALAPKSALRDINPWYRSLGAISLDAALKLNVEGQLFYVQPATLMLRSRPDEVCTPSKFKNRPDYKCDEGQRETRDCVLLIQDSAFREVGFLKINLNRATPSYCNAIVGVGVAIKGKDDLLITTQDFPIDGPGATKVQDIGQRWHRQTALVHVGLAEGRVDLVQDDRCLGNPNSLESIPDARKKIHECQQPAH